MMTREEASKILRDMLPGPIVPPVHPGSQKQEAIRVAVAALRGPTREMVERMRGEWIGDTGEKVGTIDGSPLKSSTCSNCGNWLVGNDEYSCARYFCPSCGAPMTDEAVDMMLERWKEAMDND